MVNSLENIDKSKVSADRITGLDQKIQEELSTAVTGAASTIVTTDLTANSAVISNANGKVAVSSTTSTELGYVHGVTSAIQTQLNAKAADNAVVKLTGNQTIAGEKTFTSGIKQKATLVQPIYQSTAYTKGTAPTSDTYLAHTTYRDNNNTTLMDEFYYVPNNTNAMSYILRLRDCSSATATNYNDVIKTRWDGTNGYYKIAENHETGFTTSCPPPTDTSSTTDKQIATTGWVNTKLQDIGGGMPDYSAIITGLSFPYTAPSNGIMSFNMDNFQTYLTINSFRVDIGGNDGGNEGSVQLPLSKNDVVTINVSNYHNLIFIPLKGA